MIISHANNHANLISRSNPKFDHPVNPPVSKSKPQSPEKPYSTLCVVRLVLCWQSRVDYFEGATGSLWCHREAPTFDALPNTSDLSVRKGVKIFTRVLRQSENSRACACTVFYCFLPLITDVTETESFTFQSWHVNANVHAELR